MEQGQDSAKYRHPWPNQGLIQEDQCFVVNAKFVLNLISCTQISVVGSCAEHLVHNEIQNQLIVEAIAAFSHT